ncbi:MAG: hypothetical protein KJS91_13185 [Planctomycetes bacterium]|nr:hypothetical protein [Planctomycetota bacterium]
MALVAKKDAKSSIARAVHHEPIRKIADWPACFADVSVPMPNSPNWRSVMVFCVSEGFGSGFGS